MDKQKITIIALSVTLFLIVQYIIIEKWDESNRQSMIDFYQRGYEEGLIDAVTILFQETRNCEPVTIAFGNLTKQVLDVTCLGSNPERFQP